MTRPIRLIGAPTDVGAGTRGASMGPEAFRVAGLQPTLQSHGLHVTDWGNVSGPANPWQAPVSGYRHLVEVAAWNHAVHEAVHAALEDGELPILLGGDHCLRLAPSAQWPAVAASRAKTCACCGWTRTPTSTRMT